jgi:benzylsuccinate CoA-transferase BbsF subunit
MILADLGAEVIKVESSVRIDVLRWSGAFADGVMHYDRSGYYTACNRGKLSATINLKEPAARDLILDLVAVSDAVLENFSPRVLPAIGLGAETMLAHNPRLVVLSMSGYGATGPEHDYLAYGDHLNVASGMASITGYPEDPPTKIGTFYGDPVAGMYGALAILAGLNERDHTGVGVHLEYAEVEGLVSLIPAALVKVSAGQEVNRRGAASDTAGPQGYFPCLGDDTWVSLVVRSDAEWGELRRVLALSGIDAPEAPALSDRLAAQDAIDAAITAWTVDRSPSEITSTCQRAGVAAYPLLSAPKLLWDDHLAQRKFFKWVHHPLAGPGPIPGVTFRIADGDEEGADVRRPAPLLGQDNEYVFRRVLDLSAERYQELIAGGVIK